VRGTPKRRLATAALLLATGHWPLITACHRKGPESPTTQPVEVGPNDTQDKPPEDGLETSGTYEGTLETSKLQAAFKEKGKEAYACYEAARERNRHLEGDITIRFEILPSGAARAAVVERSTLGDDDMERCLVEIISKMSLPKPQGGVVLAEYPVGFHPSSVIPGAGEPTEEERGAYLGAATKAVKGCKKLPEDFQVAIWITAEGKALSAGYAAGRPEDHEVRPCVVDALKGASYPKTKRPRKVTYVALSAEELR
jgi:TonB family protein